MFLVQPTSIFGDLICEELDSATAGQRQWKTFEFAAAWVNLPGANRIHDSARSFLAEGGSIRATVGLDFSSTSYEGLGRLLDLEDGDAAIETHVFFDENRACTFHPKVFLFSNANQARLIVGSNNMTGAGLSTNVESALGVTGALNDGTIRAARQTLEAWRDEFTELRSKRLTRELLEELLDRRYVRTEKEIRDRRKSDTESRPSKGKPLFGRSKSLVRKPVQGTGGGESGSGHTTKSGSGEVMLMRVRLRRGGGTQLQISMRVHASPFMKGVKEVISAADGSHRRIGYDYVKRSDGSKYPNTARFEASELRGMANPVARFQWVDAGDSGSEGERVLHYKVFDADNSVEGARILAKLEAGIATPPLIKLEQISREWTVISVKDKNHAQWYRLDSF